MIEPTPILRRFVILHHVTHSNTEGVRPTHFDWMFECAGRLITFATDPVVVSTREVTVAAERLADHRLAYLEYEGEISGNRGSVQRIAEGGYELLQSTARLWHVQLRWHGIGDRRDFNSPRPVHSGAADDQRMRSEVLFEESLGTWQLRLSPPR